MSTVNFFIISTGSELINGDTIDSNGAQIASRLEEAGYRVSGRSILPDHTEILFTFIRDLTESSNPPDGIVITGGLGATADDHTVAILARLTARKLTTLSSTQEKLNTFFRKRQTKISPELLAKQALIPEGCEPLDNKIGLAHGVFCEYQNQRGQPIILAALPGVPSEMNEMLEGELIPRLKSRISGQKLHRSQFYIYGVGETTFQSRFFKTESLPPESEYNWGVTARSGHIKVFFESENSEFIERLSETARSIFGYRLLENDALSLLVDYSLKENYTISMAESCSGGLIGKLITDRPGSSAYFTGGAVTYSNEMKERILGVSSQTLLDYGAVSKECAREMAEGALNKFSSSFSVATTGIAGPEGGTPEKPVGTVYIGCAGKGRKTSVVCVKLPGSRATVRAHTAEQALFYLYNYICGTFEQVQ